MIYDKGLAVLVSTLFGEFSHELSEFEPRYKEVKDSYTDLNGHKVEVVEGYYVSYSIYYIFRPEHKDQFEKLKLIINEKVLNSFYVSTYAENSFLSPSISVKKVSDQVTFSEVEIVVDCGFKEDM